MLIEARTNPRHCEERAKNLAAKGLRDVAIQAHACFAAPVHVTRRVGVPSPTEKLDHGRDGAGGIAIPLDCHVAKARCGSLFAHSSRDVVELPRRSTGDRSADA